MRTLLLGTDFMYKNDGSLVPIEINTNVGMDGGIDKIENDDVVFDLTELNSFIINNSFIKVVYIGGMNLLNVKLTELCGSLNIEYIFHKMANGITIPYVEDDDSILIIRSAYDSTAIVDEEYCKVKTNFMKLINNESFNSKFAYTNIDNSIINSITINDNGNHPNLILKSIYPEYDKNKYPKLYKVSNQEELNVVLQNVAVNNYLTEFHFNPNKLYENHIRIIRSLNLLFPPNLVSIPIGCYTKITNNEISENCEYDPITFEISSIDRRRYLTTVNEIWTPKLLDTDLVEMEDCSFKTALDLEVGDIVKTIFLPGMPDLTSAIEIDNFSITYDELFSGATYTSNEVVAKYRVNRLTELTTIYFTDETNWQDTNSSKYLIERNELIVFKEIGELVAGDKVILINPQNCTEINFVEKIVSSIENTKTFFGGWEITVREQHLFLTKTTEDINSYVAIEHNLYCSCKSCLPDPTCGNMGGCNNYCLTIQCCVGSACTKTCA